MKNNAFVPESSLYACSRGSAFMCLLHVFQEQTSFWVGKAQSLPSEKTRMKFLKVFFQKLMLAGFRPGCF